MLRAVSVGGAGSVLSRYLNPATSLMVTQLSDPALLSSVKDALGPSVIEARPVRMRFGWFNSGVIVFESSAARDAALSTHGPNLTVDGSTVLLSLPRSCTPLLVRWFDL